MSSIQPRPIPSGEPSPRSRGEVTEPSDDASATSPPSAAEASFFRFADSLSDLVWSARPDGTADYFNRPCLDYLGLDPQEAGCRPWTEFLHPDDAPAARAAWEKASRAGGDAEYEFRLRRHDGQYRRMRCRGSSLRGEDGRIIRWFGTLADIDDRRLGEDSQAPDAHYRLIAELANEGIWLIDCEQKTTFVNATMARMLDYEPGEMVGRSAWDFTFEQDRPSGDRQWERRRSGVSDRGEFRLRRKDGSAIWTQSSTSPLPGPDGAFAGALGMFTDITERKQAEEALRAREADYQAIYDQAAVGIAEVDMSGRFLRVNDRYCEILGYDREELLRRTFQELTHPDDLAGTLGKFEGLSNSPSSYTIEKRYIRGDGRPVWARLAVSLVRHSADRPASVLAVAEDVTDRVLLEIELRRRLEELAEADRRKDELLTSLGEGERRFRGLMEQAPFSIQVLSPEGRTVHVNRAWEELWGLTIDDLADYNILEDPQLKAAGLTPYLRKAFEGEASSVPVMLYDPNETLPGATRHPDAPRWVSSVAYPLKDAAGGIREVVLVHEDISTRRRAEEALRESEERFRTLAAAMPQIVWISRPDDAVEFYNERWYEYTGLSPDVPVTPDGWRTVVHPDDQARLIELGATSRGGGGPFEAEYRLRHRDGSYRWHLGRAVTVRDASGRVVRRLGTATDIDDRRRAEQDARFLAEASEALATLTDESEALQQIARLAVPHFADWVAVDMLGPDGLLERLAVAHVDPAKVELGYEIHRRYPTRPDSERPGEIYHVVRTGQPALFPEITPELLALGAQDEDHLRILIELGLRSYIGVPMIGREGPLGTIAFIAAESGRRYRPEDLRLAQDLARRAAVAVENARLYDALREADRRKDEFLATLAHELRNPLAPIRSNLQLMAFPAPDGQGHEAERAMAERQAIHLTRLVDDLMDVARISRGKIELRRNVVALEPIVVHAIEAVRASARERGHVLNVKVSGEPILIDADPTRIEQVIDNLLTNAVKYTEPGGRISLSVAREGDLAAIRVSDTGIGIPSEMLPHVFEMFAQVDGRSPRAQGGLGIGLGLARKLVEMHGGTVTASSSGPGLGSTFEVRLPARLAVADSTAAGGPTADGGDRPPRRKVLVVDDNADAAQSLARLLLRLHGQDVRVANDGAEALALAEEFRPEIILLDIGMPGMDGHQVARAIRSRAEFASTKLVALTGWGQESERRRSRESGFDLHLVKPVEPEELSRLLRDFAGSLSA